MGQSWIFDVWVVRGGDDNWVGLSPTMFFFFFESNVKIGLIQF